MLEAFGYLKQRRSSTLGKLRLHPRMPKHRRMDRDEAADPDYCMFFSQPQLSPQLKRKVQFPPGISRLV
jgi:hypothetical protein